MKHSLLFLTQIQEQWKNARQSSVLSVIIRNDLFESIECDILPNRDQGGCPPLMYSTYVKPSLQ